MDKKFYGLTLSKKVKLQAKTKSIFDSDDEDGPSSQSSKNKPSKQSIKNKNIEKKFLEEDPNIYEYDSVYDSLKEKETKKVKSAEEKKPRYIDNLLKAATKRKKDYEILVEKQIQVERAKEGDEFADKDSFVTSAYKQKLAEMEAEQEKERVQSHLDEMMDVTKQKDLSGFYRHYLKQTVGEEKIPVFGDQKFTADIKTNPDGTSKEKNKSDSASSFDEECSIRKNADAHTSAHKGREEQRHMLQERPGYKNRESSHDSKNESKDPFTCDSEHSHSRKEKRKRIDSGSDSDMHQPAKEDLRHANKPPQKERKYENEEHKHTNEPTQEVDLDDDYEDEDDNSVSGDEASTSKETLLKDKKSKTHNKKDISSLFTKRTVGAVFDEAQARYFQRMAAKNVSTKA